MTRMLLLMLTALCAASAGNMGAGTNLESPNEHGIIIAAKTYEAICWYEYLKNYLPKTRSLDFNQCNGQADFQRKMIIKLKAPEKYFGQFLSRYAMDKIPPEYQQCSQYLLQDRFKTFSTDYSDIFNNTKPTSLDGGTYPYKAFSNCLVSVLHTRHKDDALKHLDQKLTHSSSWDQTMFDRENEFRTLHSSGRLAFNEELKRRAQLWADQLARDCKMYHIHSSHPDYFLNGSRMGENLFMGDGIHNAKEDMALFGTNIWYEEIEHYPWPEYEGYGEDPFHKFSHFSQMIWKSTYSVGYGYAVNSSSSCGQYFIVARYFPPGNFWGSFGENILPL